MANLFCLTNTESREQREQTRLSTQRAWQRFFFSPEARALPTNEARREYANEQYRLLQLQPR